MTAQISRRQATFAKRKAGLLKKAMELSVLCGADVAVVVFDARGQRYEGGFLADGGVKGAGADAVLARRAAAAAAHTAAAQTTGTAELLRKYHGAEGGPRSEGVRQGGGSSGGEEDDEEDDDDEEGGDDSGSSPPRKRVRHSSGQIARVDRGRLAFICTAVADWRAPARSAT